MSAFGPGLYGEVRDSPPAPRRGFWAELVARYRAWSKFRAEQRVYAAALAAEAERQAHTYYHRHAVDLGLLRLYVSGAVELGGGSTFPGRVTIDGLSPDPIKNYGESPDSPNYIPPQGLEVLTALNDAVDFITDVGWRTDRSRAVVARLMGAIDIMGTGWSRYDVPQTPSRPAAENASGSTVENGPETPAAE
jgi:hypothetical protein